MRAWLERIWLALVHLALAGLFTWRWNHEAVRVYDLPPVAFWPIYLLTLPLLVLSCWITARNRTESPLQLRPDKSPRRPPASQ